MNYERLIMIFKNNSYKNFIQNSLPLIYVMSFLIYIFLSSLLFRYNLVDLKSISVIVAILGFFGLMIYIISKVINRLKLDFFDFLIFLLTLFGIIATIFAINKQVSLMGFWNRHEGLVQIFSYYILFLNCKNINNIKTKEIIVSIILIIIVIQAIYGILQFFDIRSVFGIKILRNKYYSNGFLTNPNFFGSLMVIGFGVSISLFFFKNESKFDYKYLVLSFFMFMGLLTSGTMSAIVAMFILMLFVIGIIFILKYDLKTMLIKWLIITSLFLLGYKIFSFKDDDYLTTQINKTANEISSTVKGDVKDIYGTGRIYIWRNALKIVPQNLLTGVGIDNFIYAFGEENLIDLKSGLAVDKAHNEYLQKLVTEGILSFITYLVLLGTIFIKSCIKLFKEKKANNYMFIVLFLCFVSYSIQAFFNISVIQVAPLYYIIMGLLVSKFKEVENEKN